MAFLLAFMVSSPIFFFAIWTSISNKRSRALPEYLPKKALPDPCSMEFQREFEAKLVLAGIPTELSICSDKSCKDCHPKVESAGPVLPNRTPLLLSTPKEKPNLKKKTDFKRVKTLEFVDSDLMERETRKHDCDWDITYDAMMFKHRVYFYDCSCSMRDKLHGEELKKRTEMYLDDDRRATMWGAHENTKNRLNQIAKNNIGGGMPSRINNNTSADEAFKTLARKFTQDEKGYKSNPFV